MELQDKIDNGRNTRKEKKGSVRKFLSVYLPVMTVLNLPQFFMTATTPREELNSTLGEQIISDTKGLYDFSGGFVYANFQLAGTILGYAFNQSSHANPRLHLN